MHISTEDGRRLAALISTLQIRLPVKIHGNGTILLRSWRPLADEARNAEG